MLAQGRGMSAVCVGGWSCRSHGALVARSRRAARAARGPRGRGAARPYPRTPTRGKLSLQAFARCARVLRFAQRPAVFVLAHGATRRVRAGGALPPRRSLCSQPPRAGAARPYPRTPTRGKLSLQAFARCRARAALRAGVSVLAHAATRRVAGSVPRVEEECAADDSPGCSFDNFGRHFQEDVFADGKPTFAPQTNEVC